MPKSRRGALFPLVGVPYLTAIVFLAAAFLKLSYLRSNPLPLNGLLHSLLFNVVLIQAELVVAALLIWREGARIGGIVGIVALSSFTAYNIVKWRAGDLLCHCLGAFSVHAGVMTAIDGSLLLLLLAWMFREAPRMVAGPVDVYTRRASWVILIIAFLVPFVAKPPSATGALSGIMALDSDRFDFGRLDPRDAKKTHTFHLTNNGIAPLIVDHISTTCGCTTTHLADSSIPPHGTIDVPVVIDWSRKAGRLAEGVEIQAHSGSRKDVASIMLVGEVYVPIRISTTSLNFGTVTSAGSSAEVRLGTDVADEPLQISDVSFDNPAFSLSTAVVDGATATKPPFWGKDIRLTLVCKPVRDASSFVQGEMAVILGKHDLPPIKVSLEASAQDDVRITPSVITLAGREPTTVSVFSYGTVTTELAVGEGGSKSSILTVTTPHRIKPGGAWSTFSIQAKEVNSPKQTIVLVKTMNRSFTLRVTIVPISNVK